MLLALCVIGLRAATAYHQQLDELRAALHQGIVHGRQFAEHARDRLVTVRLVAENYLQRSAGRTGGSQDGALVWQPTDRPGGFGGGDDRTARLLASTFGAPPRGLQSEIEAALALDPLFRVTVDSDPDVRQVFYASLRGFANMHPWWPSRMAPLEAGHLDLTVFDLGRAEINPLRETYWLAPVADPRDGGLVATIAAPVDDGGRFTAVVGLEVALSGAGRMVNELGLPFGTVYLVDRQYRVVAAAGPGADDGSLFEPAGRSRGPALAALSAREFHFVDGSLLYRLPLRDLPLALVFRASLDEFVMALMPPLAELAAVFGFIAVAGWLLRQRAGAVEAKRESEELFRVLVETAPVGLALTRSGDGEIVALNPVASRLLGIAPDSARRRRASEFYVDPRDRKRMLAVVGEQGAVSDFEVRLKSDDGCEFWSQVSGTPTRYRGETVLLASITDVTARKRADQRLRLSEERHRAIFSTASVGIALLDTAGRFLQVNQAWCAMLGYSAQKAGGMLQEDVVHPEDWPDARAGMDRLLDRDTDSLRQEIRFVRSDGTLVWGDIAASVVGSADGPAEGIVAVIVDTTARRAYEAELEAARHRLEDQADELRRTARHLSIARREAERALMVAEQANRAKSHFLAAMSHELRTPLNAILGFSELIRDRTFGPEAMDRYAQYAGDVHDSGSYLLDLINDILDISKIEAGKIEIDRAEVDLRALLEGVMRLVKVRADGGGLTLELELAERAAFVVADERALKQIAFNLLSNAIKFTPSGGRILVCASADEDRIELSVVDSGIGIPPEALQRVMNPFEQLDNRFDRPTALGGSGLGLSLVRALAELHGGEVRIESTVNVGTRVTVILPRLNLPRALPGAADNWTARAVGQ